VFSFELDDVMAGIGIQCKKNLPSSRSDAERKFAGLLAEPGIEAIIVSLPSNWRLVIKVVDEGASGAFRDVSPAASI
jgi:hypothetical protein